ncbi:MAG TPA: ester cyclase [Bryobacteraceae bacterium]|nr:ester cyclase [Bryobacteraceae bacterium]
MSEKENGQVMEQALAAVNAGDFNRFASFLDENIVVESEMFPEPVRGCDAARQQMEARAAAFPDQRIEILQVLASGDHVVVRTRMTGTHKGTFNGIAPTNKSISVEGCTITEIRNGKVIRARPFADNVSLLKQLGVITLGKTMSAR